MENKRCADLVGLGGCQDLLQECLLQAQDITLIAHPQKTQGVLSLHGMSLRMPSAGLLIHWDARTFWKQLMSQVHDIILNAHQRKTSCVLTLQGGSLQMPSLS